MRYFKIIAAIIGVGVNLAGYAQNLTAYRYWYNDDLATLVTSNVTPTQVLEIEEEIPTAGIVSNGHHTVTIQIQDNDGNWSVPYTKKFLQNGALDMLEYWIDDDITASTTQPLSPAMTQNVEASLDVSALSPGIHRLTLRSLTSNGMSSAPHTVHFKVGSGELVNWEYWFDDDLATVTQESLAPAQSLLELIEDLNTSNLSEGAHTVTWRTESATGNYSVPVTYAFDLVLNANYLDGVESLLVFPIPAREQISLKLESSKQVELRVELFSANGQFIRSMSKPLTSVQNLLNIQVSDLAPGVYLIKVSNSDGAVSHRFVKE